MFNKAFRSDNPFWQSMGTVYDLFIVNSLWLLCSLPVFTIGPATAAAFYALAERLLGESGGISRDFFSSFRRNFKQGVLLGLPLTALGIFLAADIWLCRRSGTGIYTFFMFFFAVIFLFWCFVTLYTFPILAKFELGSRDILIRAFTLSIQNLPMTLTMLFVTGVCLWFCHIAPGLIFIMFGIAAQFCTTIMLSIFRPWLPKPEPADEDADSSTTGDPAADNSYADFDESAFYGDDPEAVRKLLDESYSRDEDK